MQLTEKDLRRQIDRSLSRALADTDFARQLLTNPALAIEEHGCTPQQLKSLLSIRATTLVDFARQAQALFWAAAGPQPQCPEEPLPLAVAARH
jgi:hypothetical protein